MPVKNSSEDRLQKRLAEFIAPTASARAVNGGEQVCVGTFIGAVRKKNEDRALIIFVSYPDQPDRDFVLGAVSDGIGGLPRGDEASVLTISEFCAQVVRFSKLPIGARLLAAADAANEAVYSELKGKGGATLSAAFIEKGQILGINVGDSRIYSISESKKLKQLTKDDTLAGYLARREGGFAGQADNSLVQFVGMGKGVEPHIIDANGNEAHSILVTSDGVHGAPEGALSEVVRASRTNFELANRLLTLSTILGGRDNATALILPLNFSPDRPSQHGINITCISPFDRLEIWIPMVGTESLAIENGNYIRQNDNMTNLREDAPSDKAFFSKGEKGATASRKRKRKTQKKKASNDETALPLEEDRPPLDISFPERQKQKL